MERKRLACILVPGFSLEVCGRDCPLSDEQPTVVAKKAGDNAALVAINGAASEWEVSFAMTVAQARSRCPGLHVVVRDNDREDEESGKLIKLLQAVGPFVEEDEPGRYFLEASGLMKLYGSEEKLAREILDSLRKSGYPLRVGVADNKLVARIAANLAGAGEYVIVESGGEQEFLAPLEVDHLLLPDETREKLHDLGIRTVGQLAMFPAHEVTRRFGDEVIALAQYARGGDPSMFLPEQLSSKRYSRTSLDYPVYESERLTEYLRSMLEQLLKPLAVSEQGCGEVALYFRCEDHTTQVIRVAVDEPTASVTVFLRQMRRTFEQTRLSSGVIDMVIAIPDTVSLYSEQLQLDRESGANARSTSDVVAGARLDAHLYGIERQPRPLPEQGFVLMPYPLPKKKGPGNGGDVVGYPPYAIRPVYGLRLLSPARQAEVVAKAGRLQRLEVDHHMQTVMKQSGPWKLSGGWWVGGGESGFDRLYYEVETSEHRAYLLFYDRLSSRWFLQGIFD